MYSRIYLLKGRTHMPGDSRINLRVSSETLAELKEGAQLAKMSLTTYLVQLGLDMRTTLLTEGTQLVEASRPAQESLEKSQRGPSRATREAAPAQAVSQAHADPMPGKPKPPLNFDRLDQAGRALWAQQLDNYQAALAAWHERNQG